MITPLSKGEMINFSAGTSGTIYIAKYRCLVMYYIKNFSATWLGSVMYKRRAGVNISLIMNRQFVSNIVMLEEGETVFASGILGAYSLYVMRYV
jgi:hypothetical protein